MKRRKKLWIMGAVLGLVLVLTVSVALIDQKVETIRESGEVILQIPADSVTALSWDHEGETISLTRDDAWHYTEDPDFPVDPGKVEDLLEVFDGLTASFCIEKVEDYSQYGLTEPVATIHLTAAEQDYAIKLGAFSKMDEQRYVDIGDGNAYLLFHDPMMEFDTGLRDIILNDETPYLDTADRITFSGTENYSIERQPEGGKSYREEDLYFARINGQLLPLDTATVENYISDLTLVGLSNYQTYTASQEELSQWGLDQPELSVTVDYTKKAKEGEESEKVAFTLHLARDPEALLEAEKAEDPDTVTVPMYAMLDGSELVYEITQAEADRITACAYNDLRHSEVFPAATENITALELTMDDNTYHLESTPDEKDDEKLVFTYAGQEADISQILTALHSLHVQEFTEEAPTEKLELRLLAALETGDTVSLELYRKDGELCLARVDGKTVALLPRSQVVELKEQINTIVLNPVAEATEETA